MIPGVPDRCDTEVWRTHRLGGSKPERCGARTTSFYLAERDGDSVLIGRCPDHPFPVDQIAGWGHNGWLYKVRRLTREEATAVEVHRT